MALVVRDGLFHQPFVVRRFKEDLQSSLIVEISKHPLVALP